MRKLVALPDFCAALIMLLFAYAGIIKLLDFKVFSQQLGLSPLIPGRYAGWVAILLPLGELLICWWLCRESRRIRGLYAALYLLSFFTVYLLVLLGNSFVPCSCGGLLGNMSWTVHIIFNICFCGIAIGGILTHK